MSDQLPPPPSYPPPPPSYPPPTQAPRPAWRRGPVAAVVLGCVTALVVVALAVVIPLAGGDDDEPGTAAGERGPVTLDDVRAYDDLDGTHTDGDVDYPQTPPVGGPHAPVWLDCGVYDEPVRDELVVHDLEHGTVWITHDPELPDDDVRLLAEALPENGILSPYPDLPAPVVVTVWGRQLALDGADDPRLELFVESFADGVTAPEPFASCAGGLSNPRGGTSV